MRRQLLPALRTVLVMTVLAGVLYPLAITGIAQTTFPGSADGSLLTDADGQAVGSAWVGQGFTEPGYFHPRPSAVDYDGTTTGGSSLGPTHEALLADVADRIAAYRADNDLSVDMAVPVDAVTGSGSGWDPHISVANAELQATRVAAERGVEAAVVTDLVREHTEDAPAALGEDVVHVLRLNLALDALVPR